MCGNLTAEDARGCPFCAGLSEVEKIEDGCYGIGCPDCDFQLMSGGVGIGWHESEHEAVVAWNERAHDLALDGANRAWKAAESSLADAQAEIARLRGALSRLEVSGNTVAYCYDKRPENFAASLVDLGDACAEAREVLK